MFHTLYKGTEVKYRYSYIQSRPGHSACPPLGGKFGADLSGGWVGPPSHSGGIWKLENPIQRGLELWCLHPVA